MSTLSRLIETSIAENKFSACSIGVQKFNKSPLFLNFGHTSTDRKQVVTENSFYDLASLTKAIFTTTLVAKLFEEKKVPLNIPLGQIKTFDSKIISHIKNSQYLQATVEDLLLHVAGFQAIAEYTKICPDIPKKPGTYSEEVSAKLIECASKVEPRAAIKEKTIYSDLGFIFLIEILCMHFQKSAEELWAHYIQKPMNLKAIKPGSALQKNDDFVLSVPGMPAGTLYDPAERYLGKLCGHAGLIGTLKETMNFGAVWLEGYLHGNAFIKKEIAHMFVDPYLLHERRLGWDGVSENSTAGDISKNAIGHLGYTGTSIWIDLDREMVVTLLTNRTLTQIKHADDFIPTEQKLAFNELRRDIHNEIWRMYA